MPDSLRVAGIGGVSITRTYKLPQMKFQIGNGIVTIDSIKVNTVLICIQERRGVLTFPKGRKMVSLV